MYEKVKQSVEYIKGRVANKPQVAIILGSGLGDLVEAVENQVGIDYQDIPDFPQSTVVGHAGRLVFGTVGGVEVVLMQGRFHYYEGYSMQEVTYPVYVLQQLGVKQLIVTNACGGINTSFEPGTLMLINDFINLFGTNPLIGRNDERFGPRFPDMSEPYKKELIALAKTTADQSGIAWREGVYAGCTGPYYETAAEIRAYAGMGADTIGMSTVPETIVANYLGLEVLGIACVTNMATGIQKGKHSHLGVLETAQKASADLCRWVQAIISNLK